MGKISMGKISMMLANNLNYTRNACLAAFASLIAHARERVKGEGHARITEKCLHKYVHALFGMCS